MWNKVKNMVQNSDQEYSTNAKQICITNFVSNLVSIKITTFILVLDFIWLIA